MSLIEYVQRSRKTSLCVVMSFQSNFLSVHYRKKLKKNFFFISSLFELYLRNSLQFFSTNLLKFVSRGIKELYLQGLAGPYLPAPNSFRTNPHRGLV